MELLTDTYTCGGFVDSRLLVIVSGSVGSPAGSDGDCNTHCFVWSIVLTALTSNVITRSFVRSSNNASGHDLMNERTEVILIDICADGETVGG